MYTEPTTPSGSTLVETARTSLTVMDSVLEVELPPLVTVTEKLLVPRFVGVPEIAPSDERLRPDGSAPTANAQVYVPVPATAEST